MIWNAIVLELCVNLFGAVYRALIHSGTVASLRSPLIFACQIGAPKWIGEALSRSRCVDLTASRLVPKYAVLIALLAQHEASTSCTLYIGGAELVDTLFDMLSEIFDLFVAHPHVAGTPAASATLRAFKA